MIRWISAKAAGWSIEKKNICMHVYMCVFLSVACVCRHVCLWECVYAQVCLWVCVYVCICVFMREMWCVCVCMCMCCVYVGYACSNQKTEFRCLFSSLMGSRNRMQVTGLPASTFTWWTSTVPPPPFCKDSILKNGANTSRQHMANDEPWSYFISYTNINW